MVSPDSQKASRDWWEKSPMTYDWHGTLQYVPGSREWFQEIDRRFLEAAYFARSEDGISFGRFLRPELVAGKRVLEIGCGMGLHASLLARAGAKLTTIDLTRRAVEMTQRRFEMFELPGIIQQADAEHLPFHNGSFDVVWSWGVIHASSSTERCFQEITRVLREGGRLIFMVYYRPSIVYYLHCGFIRGVLFGQLLYRRLQDIYVTASDGRYARVFNKAELRALLGHSYERISMNVVGQKADLLPIPPSRIKTRLEKLIPEGLASAVLGRWGSMIVIEATKRVVGRQV